VPTMTTTQLPERVIALAHGTRKKPLAFDFVELRIPWYGWGTCSCGCRFTSIFVVRIVQEVPVYLISVKHDVSNNNRPIIVSFVTFSSGDDLLQLLWGSVIETRYELTLMCHSFIRLPYATMNRTCSILFQNEWAMIMMVAAEKRGKSMKRSIELVCGVLSYVTCRFDSRASKIKDSKVLSWFQCHRPFSLQNPTDIVRRNTN